MSFELPGLFCHTTDPFSHAQDLWFIFWAHTMMKFSAGKVEHHDVWFNWKREDPAGADHRQVT